MNNLFKIFSLIYAGVFPIVVTVYQITIYYNWITTGIYLDLGFDYLMGNNLFIYFSMLILSLINNYCRYHNLMILFQILVSIASFNCEAFYSETYDYLTYNYIVLALQTLSLIMLGITLKHIIKQISKHKKKFKILFYGIFKRITRFSRRNIQDSTL